MYLLDTNIFLEILLDQEKKSACQKFISKNSDKIAISDFSFHSIAVILFRYKKIQYLKRILLRYYFKNTSIEPTKICI